VAAVTYTVVVRNTSAVDDVTIDSVIDDVFGNLSGEVTSPSLPITLAPSASFTFAFARSISGERW